MITRAPSSFRTILIASVLFAVPFLLFASASLAATTTPMISITSPADKETVNIGDAVNIDFNASNLTTAYANISLSQNGTPILNIATVNVPALQTSYSYPWTVPTLTTGTYTLTVTDGQSATTTGASSSITLNIETASLAATQPLVNIDPSQVTFDASTGSYNYDDPAQEAAFQAQVAQLNPNTTSNNQTDAAVAIVGDALVNSAGQCVGTALAGALGQSIGQLGGAAATSPTSIPTIDVSFTTKSVSTGPGQSGGLDGIANCIGTAMIQTLSNSITKWINNDFQLPDGSTGSAYLKDPTQFFQNLADVTAGQFLGSFSINGINLCSNFSLPLRLNLLQQYSTGYNQQALCTLGTVVKNLSAFTGGDFSQGGWSGWLAMTQNPNNNYYGSYAMASQQLDVKLSTAQQGVQTDLTNGNGFLSYKKCTSYGPTIVVNGKNLPGQCTSYQTVTPGSLVANAALGTQADARERLVVSNSFNQVVTALINSMITRLQNFSGSSGL